MIVRSILALLLIAMAIGQLSDIGGFVDILETYEVGSGALTSLFAGVIIALELAAGARLVVGRFLLGDRFLLPAALAAVVVTVAWSLLAGEAFARGLEVANCGCFGVHFSQSLRWWVLLEDAEFMFMAAWVLRGVLRAPARPVPATLAPVSKESRQPSEGVVPGRSVMD